jgi:hypothetical protein
MAIDVSKHAYQAPHSIISKFPEHAKALGVLLAEWAIAETGLERCLAFMLRLERDVSDATYHHFVQTKGKIELLIRLNRIVMSGDARDFLDKHLDEALELNNMRNEYVHALWAQSDDHPDTLQRIALKLPNAAKKKQERVSEWVSVQKILDDAARIAKWEQHLYYGLREIDPMRLIRFG